MRADIQDLVARLRSLLPNRWFPDEAPVLDSVLSGVAWCWSVLFELLDYAKAQARIATATDIWLDVIAGDCFGSRVIRRSGQTDDDFRRRIRAELLRERGTRAALESVLQDLIGRAPVIFEPANPADTGGYGGVGGTGGGLGYGAAGGWGNLCLPFQSFVTAYRPEGTGIGSVNGWGGFAGAYGAGACEYASLAMILGRVTDADINSAIAGVLPVSSICWTRISS